MGKAFLPDFYQLPYHLVKRFGYEKTSLLIRLQQWQKYADARDWNQDEHGDCWHWHTREILSQETLLSEKQIRSYLIEFKEIGLVKWEQKGGFDRKCYFWVDLNHSLWSAETLPSLPEGNMEGDLREGCMLTKGQDARCPKGRMAPILREDIKEEIKERIICDAPSASSLNPGESPCETTPDSESLCETGVSLCETPTPTFREKRIKKDPNKDFCDGLNSSAPPLNDPGNQPTVLEPQTALEPKPSKKDEKTPKEVPATTQVWNEYSKAFERRYRTLPIRSAKVNAQLKNLVADFGVQIASQMPSWYLADNDQFVVNQAHPISLLVNRAHKYAVEMANKKRITRSFAKRAEMQGELTETFREVDESIENGQSITQMFKEVEERAKAEEQRQKEIREAQIRAYIEGM